MDTLHIMFIGDSLAAGFFATRGERDGFAGVTIAGLEKHHGHVESVSAHKAGGTVKVANVLSVPPNVDVIVTQLGTNDSLHTPLHTFHGQYDAMLRMIREGSPDGRLVCMGLWRRTWRAWPYDLIIARLAKRYGGTFLRLSDMYPEPSYRGPVGGETFWGTRDNFHPNDAGHRAIGERLLAHLGA